MIIPTEPIGSIPRPLPLIEALKTHESEDPSLRPLYEAAIRDTIERFEATGSPVITDGEQKKYQNFGTYCVHGLPNLAQDGFKIPFVSHTRRWPRLTSGPFRYRRYADSFLYIALAGERDRLGVLKMIAKHLKPHQRAFVGVVTPIDPRMETPEEVRDRVLEAAEYIPLHQLGTTDDCGFSPFSDDTSTSRDTAFAKIRARVLGTAMATEAIGGG